MRLKSLKLDYFRNYDKIKIEFRQNIVIFVGENAQGKTNILEAIYYLATGSAYRPNKDRELINWKNDYFSIKAEIISHRERDITIEIDYIKQKKSISINGVKKNKLQDLFGNLNVVIFAPEDLILIKGTPGDRRRFLNKEISQVSSQYYYFYSQYNKILLQRNSILKKIAFSKRQLTDQLNVWDNQLVYYGSRVVKWRLDFIYLLSKYAALSHQALSGNTEELSLTYTTNTCDILKKKNIISGISIDDIAEEFLRKLKETAKDEVDKATTLIGPHRDDIDFIINEKDLKYYGSQGQQRSAVLSVKLAQIKLIKDKLDTFPILLLDDVMSELDQKRREHLLQQTESEIQTFITTTHLHSFNEKVLNEAQLLKVDKGRIYPTS
ncbi:MAG: DNA replication/repair protein RecF [Bacillota bacterium]|nr:DNA replication/repair protein RecF [Bacillota bacterium]